jgi:hypothetical protein
MKQNKLSSVSKRQFGRSNKSNKLSYCTYLLYSIVIFSILLLIGTIFSDDIYLTISSRFTNVVGYTNTNTNPNNKLSRESFKQKKEEVVVDIITDKPLYEVNSIKFDELINEANKYNEEYESNKKKKKEKERIREEKRLKKIQDKKDFDSLTKLDLKKKNKPDYKGLHHSLIPVVEPVRCGETLTDSGNIPEEKRICVLPHKQKEGIKLDLRIKLDNIDTNFTIVNRPHYDIALTMTNKAGKIDI